MLVVIGIVNERQAGAEDSSARNWKNNLPKSRDEGIQDGYARSGPEVNGE